MTTWIYLHTERSCGCPDRDRDDAFDRPGMCQRPAWLGGMCSRHFYAATPALRAVALLIESLEDS